MAKNRKKIGIIFATGTVLSIKNNKTIFFVESEDDADLWLKEMPELSIIADINPYFFMAESQSLVIQDIEKLAGLIDSLKGELDGFVLLVRADSLLPVAAGLSFLLQNFPKPVICTGSIVSPQALEEGRLSELSKRFTSLGLKSNVINAVQVATKELPKIAIMYGSKLLEPHKAIKKSLDSVNLFEAFDDEYLGKVEFSIKIDYKTPSTKADYKKYQKLDPSIIVINSLFVNEDFIKNDKSKALIIEMRENEVFLENIRGLLADLHKPVILYNFWYVLEHRRLITISKMTKETLIAKVMWLLGQDLNKDDFTDLMMTNVIGEMKQ